jgi:hypothetical protein
MSCPLINSIFVGALLELLDPDICIRFNFPNISAQSIGIKKSTSPVIYASSYWNFKISENGRQQEVAGFTSLFSEMKLTELLYPASNRLDHHPPSSRE